MGQALFALGVSAGIMIAYGAYMPAGESLATRGAGRHRLDIRGVVARDGGHIPAGVSLRPGSRPADRSSFFEVLPVAFAEMPGGRVIGTLFFALLILAAFTPSVGLLEPWIAWLVERGGMRRPLRGVPLHGFVLAARPGLGAVVRALGRLAPLPWVPRLAALNVFGLHGFSERESADADVRAAGEPVRRLADESADPEGELSGLSPASRRLLMFALRYVCPLGIVVVVIVGFAG